MKLKAILWTGVLTLIAGIVAAAVWWALKPQTITFSDDAKLTLISVDYGKKHTPPTVKSSSGEKRTRRTGAFTTTNDTLVLWVRQQYDSKQYHYFQYYVYDKEGAACVQTYGSGGSRNGNEVVGVRLDAFPRRQGKFYVRVQEQGNGGQEIAEEKFIIRNPAKKPSIEWAPESLPDAQDDGDVTVTLKKLLVGAKMPYTRNNDDPDDPSNLGVKTTFRVERNGKPVKNWQPVAIETSDATGNRVTGWISNNQWQDDEDTVTYQYGLWPDEPVWKLRCEFSQQSDFSPAELWTLQIPVVPGKQQEMYGGRRQATSSTPFAQTDLNGLRVKIFPAKDFTDSGNNNWMQGGLFLEISGGELSGYRVTVKVTDEQSNDIQCNNYGDDRLSGNQPSLLRYRLQDVAGLTNLNVSVALHKSRYVEFKVKPEKASAATE